mmetsp:Transcript_17565/g.49618  ORF Transcript_17565/g.49618 Transcript_17565/m.49618 type:complete len:233 (+) Transcript_17565:1255-1953(+)
MYSAPIRTVHRRKMAAWFRTAPNRQTKRRHRRQASQVRTVKILSSKGHRPGSSSSSHRNNTQDKIRTPIRGVALPRNSRVPRPPIRTLARLSHPSSPTNHTRRCHRNTSNKHLRSSSRTANSRQPQLPTRSPCSKVRHRPRSSLPSHRPKLPWSLRSHRRSKAMTTSSRAWASIRPPPRRLLQPMMPAVHRTSRSARNAGKRRKTASPQAGSGTTQEFSRPRWVSCSSSPKS